MKRKVLSLFIAAVFFLALSPHLNLTAQALENGGFLFEINGSTAVITGYSGPENNIKIPEIIGEYPVTAIARGALTGEDLTNVYIPASVSQIGDNYCTWGSDIISTAEIVVDEENQQYSSKNGVLYNKDKSILLECPTGKSGTFVIPASVNIIGAQAFAQCVYLTQIILPGSLITVNPYAFAGCIGLSVVDLKNTQSLCLHAFDNCLNLEEVSFANIYLIDERVFCGCGIARLIFHCNAPPMVHEYAFDGNTGLTVFYYNNASGFANSWNGLPTQQLVAPYADAPIGAVTVFDADRGFIYGLEPALTVTCFENSYVQINGNARLVYEGVFMPVLGTGCAVSVIDNETEAVLEEYSIIIFGDSNGDSNIDTSDAGLIVDYENFFIQWDPFEDSAFLKAADVNGDGNIDTGDAAVIVDVENFLLTINQMNGLAVPC